MSLKLIGGFLFLMLLNQACMLTSKMDKVVTTYYIKNKPLRPVQNKNNFLIRTDGLKHMNGMCKSKYERFLTVPLLVYFYSGEKINCEINPQLYVPTLIDEINRALENDSTGILTDKKLEISVNAIPNKLAHVYFNHSFIVQFLFGGLSVSLTENRYKFPGSDLGITYALRDKDNMVIKQDNLYEAVPGYVLERSGNFSQRKFCIEAFVTAYDHNMNEHCKILAQTLVNEIK